MPKKPTITPTAATYDQKAYMAAMRERLRKDGVKSVRMSLSAQEYAHMAASAKKANEKITPHIKRLAFAYSQKQYLVPPTVETDLADLLSVVRGIGTNINQMARHSNEVKAVLHQNDMFLELKRLNDAIRGFIRQPARATP